MDGSGTPRELNECMWWAGVVYVDTMKDFLLSPASSTQVW